MQDSLNYNDATTESEQFQTAVL